MPIQIGTILCRKSMAIFLVKNELFRNIVEVIFKPEKNRLTRETRISGVGRGGVELFRPRGVIGRGPEGP